MSTCIGALPIGTLAIGVLAELLGTRPALATSSSIGLCALGLILLRFRGRLGPGKSVVSLE
jgi:hypothetical protein